MKLKVTLSVRTYLKTPQRFIYTADEKFMLIQLFTNITKYITFAIFHDHNA